MNRAKVAAALKKGRYDDVTTTAYSRLDELMTFMAGLGVFGLFDRIKDELTRSGAIPRFVIYNLMALKALLGEESLLHMSKGIFRDQGVLRAIGVTAAQIREGFDPSRNRGENKPFHIDSVRYAISRVPVSEAGKLFKDGVGLLHRAGFLRKARTYIIDSTPIEVDGNYEDMGLVAKTKDVVTQTGELKREHHRSKGFKLTTLAALTETGPLVVAAEYRAINASETAAADQLLKGWSSKFSPGDVLLIDRGFLDGARLWAWHKNYGLDFVIPLRKDMDIRRDMIGLSRLGPSVVATRGGTKKKPALVVEGSGDLTSYNAYPGKLSGILVTTYKGKQLEPGKQWGFITTLPVTTADEALAVYDAYDLRSRIENQGYRELKQGFELPRFFGKDRRSQHFHVFFTLLMYNMVAAYKSNRAEKFLGRGVRYLRSDFIGLVPRVIVYTYPYFAIFDIRELLTLLGRPPTGKLDNVSIRYA